MLKIYGSPQSSAGRCFWCLEEVGATYDTQAVNFKEGQHKSPEYLKINSNGKVPTLTDNDFTIWESAAINMYLAEKYKPELLGSSPEDRALVSQWNLWAIAELQNPMIEVFIQLVFVPDDKRDAKVIEKATNKLPVLLATLNSSLEGKTYLVGNDFSIADLNVSSVVNLAEHIKFDITEYKNITKWLSKLQERPAYKRFLELSK